MFFQTLGPAGKHWGTSTLVEMLRDSRLGQYAGIGYWNKENHQTIGTRFNPRDQWVRVDNAHTAIINEDEVQLALARKTNGRKNATISRANGSPWLPIAGTGH
jgi:hypothetical protein